MPFLEIPITRNKYWYFDCLAQTLHTNNPETFKVEILDYQTMKDDHGYVQIGEITFSLHDVVPLNNSDIYTINKPIIHKTAYSNNIPYKSSNISLPANLQLRFHYNNPKYNSNISLYDSETDQILSASVYLVRTTGQLLTSGISNMTGKCCWKPCDYSIDNHVDISNNMIYGRSSYCPIKLKYIYLHKYIAYPIQT